MEDRDGHGRDSCPARELTAELQGIRRAQRRDVGDDEVGPTGHCHREPEVPQRPDQQVTLALHRPGEAGIHVVSETQPERDRRLDERRRLSAALAAGLRDTRAIPVEEVVAALPRELVAGGDQGRLGVMLERYRESLYPEDVRIDVDAARRVEQANRVAGLLKAEVELGTLLDRAVQDG